MTKALPRNRLTGSSAGSKWRSLMSEVEAVHALNPCGPIDPESLSPPYGLNPESLQP